MLITWHVFQFGMNALLWAAWFGHKEAVRLLLGAGAKPTSRNKNGYTLLHCAAQNNHIMIEEILLEDVADFDIDTTDDVSISVFCLQSTRGVRDTNFAQTSQFWRQISCRPAHNNAVKLFVYRFISVLLSANLIS